MNVNDGALNFDAYIADTDFKRSIDDMKTRVIGLSSTTIAESNKMDNAMKKLGAGLATYFSISTIKNFGSEIIKVRGDFQQLEVAFNTMLKSKEKSSALMAQIVETAATTPFDLQSVAGGAKQLLAYGEGAETVNETLVRLGNIASGLSLPLNDLVYLYGTTMVQGRLFTQDVRQFMGRGIPLVQELASELGKTTEEINQMVTDGKIGFPEVQRVIERLTNEGGMFYNLMQEQSKTLSGQISNLQDDWSSMLNDIGTKTEGVISSGIEFLASMVEHYEEILKVIKVLIITYGAYKAAIIAVNAVKAVSIALSKGYTVAELAQYAALLLVEKAQKILNATMLANPYVLATAALVGLIAAVATFTHNTTDAEIAQKRFDDAIARSEQQVTDEIAKLQSLITVIKSETTSQKAKADALRDLIALSPEHLAGITEEEIRTGAAKTAIDDYVESLRRKIQFEELEKELSESIKRENAAAEGKNEIGWFRKLILYGAAGEYNPNYDPNEAIQESNDALNARIIANEKAYQERIKARMEEIYSGNNTGGNTDSEATSAIKTVGDRIKEIDDQISALESKRNKLAATDVAGIKKVNEEIENLEKEKKKLEGKNTGKDDSAVSGSLAYYKKIKEEAVKALSNLSTSDKYFATKQADLLAKIGAAETKINEIEAGHKQFSEQLETRKKQYQTYNKWVQAIGKEAANAEFSELIKGGNTYVEYLNNQISELQAKQAAGTLGEEESKKLVTLMGARSEATGEKSAIEIFRENLSRTKEEASSLVEYLERVKELENELADDNSELGIEKKITLADEEENTEKEIQSQTKQYLVEYESYNQKRLRLEKEYQYKKSLIEKVNTSGQYDDQLAELEKEYKSNLSDLDTQVTAKSDLWIRLFADASALSRKQIRTVINDTRQLLDYMNGATTDKPIGFTDAQIQSLKDDPEKIKAIYDALLEKQEELENRSDYQFSSVVKGFNDLKRAADLTKKAQSEQNEETQRALLLQAEMSRTKGVTHLIEGVQEFGGILTSFADGLDQLAEATSDDGLKSTAEAINSFGNIISSTASGALAGGWIGAIIGLVTSVGGEIFNAFTQSEKSAEEARQNLKDYARAYQMLLLDLKEEDYESVFGTRSIAEAAEAYIKMNDALSQYNAHIQSTEGTTATNQMIDKLNEYYGLGMQYLKYATDLENMSVKVKDYSGFQEFFGATDKYKSLKDLAPEMWNNDGSFNVEVARVFLETNTQITDEQRKQIQNVIDLYDQYQELNDIIEADIKDSFGDLGSVLVDSITEAMQTGGNVIDIATKKYASSFETLGEKIAYELFFADAFDDLLKKLKETYALGDTEKIGLAQMDLIAGFFSSMQGQVGAAEEWLKQWKEYGEKYGFDLWSNADADTAEDPLTGAVQKITSEEASAISGQMIMLRIKQDQANDFLNQQLVQLIGIRENTAKAIERLDTVIDLIKSNSTSQTNSLRSKGL